VNKGSKITITRYDVALAFVLWSFFALIWLVLFAITADAQQSNVITQKVGASNMYIFAPEGTTIRRIGTIKVGNTITIRYGIRVDRNAKARFINMDSEKVTKGKVAPTLKTDEGDAEGFVVEDKAQGTLSVVIDPKLMKQVATKADRAGAAKRTMSREANLNVEFYNDKGKIKILKVTVN
jgi:hypothetical protein